MKKRKRIRIIIVVMAATVMMGTARGQQQPTHDSEVEIVFEEGSESVAPVDPEDPSKPLEPGGNGATSQTGALTLNYVSAITFGRQQVKSEKAEYKSETIRPFIQVTDLRGTGAGWRVTAKANRFYSNGETSLPGAEIHLRNGGVISESPMEDKPDAKAVIDLPTDGEVEIGVVEAGLDKGMGTWVTYWFPAGGTSETENDNVTLTVYPGTATTMNPHIATITWTLINDVSEP